MDHLTAHDLVLVGLVAQAVLALLFGLVWRALRGGWPAWLAIGFAANAGCYGAMAAGLYSAEPFVAPATLVALLALAAVVSITIGVVDYVGVEARHARRINAVAVLVALASTPLGLIGVITRAVGYAVMASYVVGWTVLFLWAMRREPRSGHGVVVLALLLYPLTVAGVVTGRVSPELLSASAVLPFSALGVTLLTTGLLRTQRRAALALAERERAQALLRATNDSLEHQVTLRTAELRETIDGLESFNRTVSHDLRTPLGGIVGITRLARDKLADGDALQVQQMLDLIEGQAVNSVKLVEALLALSRASDAMLHVRDVDSASLVNDVIKALPEAVSLYCIVASQMPTVHADPELLRQVFSNLIGNAVKFTAGSPHPRVEISARTGDGQTVFEVRDNGIGFEPAAAPRLFKPFQRLHHHGYEGFGVGLSIVKRIIDRHGGRVWAEGRPGRGASFYFTLGQAGAGRS